MMDERSSDTGLMLSSGGSPPGPDLQPPLSQLRLTAHRRSNAGIVDEDMETALDEKDKTSIFSKENPLYDLDMPLNSTGRYEFQSSDLEPKKSSRKSCCFPVIYTFLLLLLGMNSFLTYKVFTLEAMVKRHHTDKPNADMLKSFGDNLDSSSLDQTCVSSLCGKEKALETLMTQLHQLNSSSQDLQNQVGSITQKRGLPGLPGPPGPPGVAGPPGMLGPMGPPGVKGSDGEPGSPGAKGASGIPGVPGSLGAKGEKGESGIAGPVGPPGNIGPPGIPGIKGDPGEIGAPGISGQKGEKGLPGIPGNPGPQGHSGITGIPGPKGSQGLQGPSGQPGPAGPPGARGPVGPQGPSGQKGSTGQKGESVSYSGPPGPPGPKGDRGTAGLAGIPGSKGQQGSRGDTGPRGVPGPKGDMGPRGLQGVKGDRGLPGTKGDKGEQVNFTPKVVRLVGSSSRGRVEVMYNGQWGTVCDDSFDTLDATVVCKMLSFQSALSVFKAAPGTGRILLDELRCTGRESSIFDCPHNGIGTNDCTHSEDVGVSCS